MLRSMMLEYPVSTQNRWGEDWIDHFQTSFKKFTFKCFAPSSAIKFHRKVSSTGWFIILVIGNRYSKSNNFIKRVKSLQEFQIMMYGLIHTPEWDVKSTNKCLISFFLQIADYLNFFEWLALYYLFFNYCSMEFEFMFCEN